MECIDRLCSLPSPTNHGKHTHTPKVSYRHNTKLYPFLFSVQNYSRFIIGGPFTGLSREKIISVFVVVLPSYMHLYTYISVHTKDATLYEHTYTCTCIYRYIINKEAWRGRDYNHGSTNAYKFLSYSCI